MKKSTLVFGALGALVAYKAISGAKATVERVMLPRAINGIEDDADGLGRSWRRTLRQTIRRPLETAQRIMVKQPVAALKKVVKPAQMLKKVVKPAQQIFASDVARIKRAAHKYMVALPAGALKKVQRNDPFSFMVGSKKLFKRGGGGRNEDNGDIAAPSAGGDLYADAQGNPISRADYDAQMAAFQQAAAAADAGRIQTDADASPVQVADQGSVQAASGNEAQDASAQAYDDAAQQAADMALFIPRPSPRRTAPGRDPRMRETSADDFLMDPKARNVAWNDAPDADYNSDQTPNDVPTLPPNDAGAAMLVDFGQKSVDTGDELLLAPTTYDNGDGLGALAGLTVFRAAGAPKPMGGYLKPLADRALVAGLGGCAGCGCDGGAGGGASGDDGLGGWGARWQREKSRWHDSVIKPMVYISPSFRAYKYVKDRPNLWRRYRKYQNKAAPYEAIAAAAVVSVATLGTATPIAVAALAVGTAAQLTAQGYTDYQNHKDQDPIGAAIVSTGNRDGNFSTPNADPAPGELPGGDDPGQYAGDGATPDFFDLASLFPASGG